MADTVSIPPRRSFCVAIVWQGQRYAVCDAELPPDPATDDAKAKHDWFHAAVHFGREALEAGVRRFNPITLSPPRTKFLPPNAGIEPAQVVRCLTVWQRLKRVASVLVREYLRASPWVHAPAHETRREAVHFRRELLTRWWRHEGNGAVVRHALGPRWLRNTADLAHVLLWDRNRNMDYAGARQEIQQMERDIQVAPETLGPEVVHG